MIFTFLKNVLPIFFTLILLFLFFLIFGDKSLYFNELLNGLLGVVIVIIATASIIVYQFILEENNSKKKLIYEKKVDAFKKVAIVLRPLIDNKKVTKDFVNELFALRLEILLICGPKSFKNFNSLLHEVQNYIHEDAKTKDQLQIAILKLFSSFALELMKESGLPNEDQKEMKNILDNISQKDVINEYNRSMEKRTFRSDKQKLEILKKFSISTKDELPKLNKEYNFNDIRIRVKLFRDQLLRKGYKEQLLEIGVSIDENENPKVGSNLSN